MSIITHYKNKITMRNILLLGGIVGVLMVIYILRTSLGYTLREGVDNITPTTSTTTTSTPASNINPIVQVGINSSSINSLREEINKLNINSINKKLDDMEEKIKTNSDNIRSINNAAASTTDDADVVNSSD